MQDLPSIAPVAPGSPVDLRPYQADAIRRARGEMRAGRKRVVIVLPTGAGKTRLASAIVYSAIGKGSTVLWLAHRTELVDQACRTLGSFGLPFGVVAATSEHRPDPEAPVQVASIQTLVARETHRPPANLIVWDEAHHASEAASTWSGLLDAYPDVPMIGLTATPERGDGAGLAPLFNGLVVGASVAQLTALGHLVPCEIVRPARMLEPGQIAQDPIAAYRDHGGGRQALLFARSVEEAQRYADELTASGTRAECVHASTPAATRKLALDCYRAGSVRVLTCVYVFTEGTDLPMAAVCILARGAGSPGIYIQMAGRVLRPAPGKTSALLIDLRGVSHVHGCPDDDRLYSLEGRGISLAQTRHCQVCSAILESGYPCPACDYAPTQADAAETVVTGDPLVKFARKRAENADERHATLLRWVRAALEKGHRPASVRFKWRAVYDEDLPMRTLMLAVQEVRNAQA